MKKGKRFVATIALLALMGGCIIGCGNEGPAEKAGKKVDETLDSAKKTFKKMTDD